MHRILAVILMIVMLMPAAQAEVLLDIHAFTCTPTENGATLTWEKEGTGELDHWQVYAYYTEPCFEVILDENIGKATTYDVIWDNDRSKVVWQTVIWLEKTAPAVEYSTKYYPTIF